MRKTLVLACVPAFMASLDTLVVTIALPTIRRDLHASVQALGWTVNAEILAFGVLMLAGSVLGDRLGRRRMFGVGLAIFTAASAACALAPSATALIAARAVQGAGAALITPLSLALVSAAFPPGARGKAVGIWGAITGSAVAFGPLVGGAIVDAASWQWIFWINVPIGVAAIALAPRLLEESYGARRPLDLPGIVLASGGLTALIWGIIRANDVGWTSTQIVLALAGGAALVVAFAARQARTAHPLVPRRLFASRTFVAANATSFLLTASLFGAAFLVPQYLQTALHESALAAGIRMLPWTGVVMIVTPLAGRLADRIGNRSLMVVGLALQASGFAALAAVATPATSYAELALPLLVSGIGVALVFPATANAIVGGVARADLGIASAANSSFRALGSPFGVAVAAAVFAHTGGFASAQAFTNGVVPGLAVAAAISVLGALAALGVRRERAADHERVGQLGAQVAVAEVG